MSTANISRSKRQPHWRYIILVMVLTLALALPGLSNLPVIDRDEARFAVASVQMEQSGDYVSIRFQDEARNKKPVGVYWAQALMIKTFAGDGERALWAQRLPSLLAALLTILATYWAAVPMIGRRGAAVGGALLATTLLFVFESHIAKTDAMLCASGALVFASFAHLRAGGSRLYSLLFWVALGLGVMIKGPVIPAIVGLCLLSLFIWERDGTWMRKLLFWPGPIMFFLIVLPWSILIYQATDGQFFKDAIMGDFGSKIISGQESHGAPPGAYLLTLPLTFWPASLFLIPGFVFALRTAKNKTDNPVTRAMRLALCWAVPFWIVLEIVPTKLPNYLLPAFPALAIICAGAVLTIMQVNSFKIARRIGAALFAILSTVLIAALLIGAAQYGPDEPQYIAYGLHGATLLMCYFAVYAIWAGRGRWAVGGVIAAALTLQPFVYQFTLPSLYQLRVADRVEAALTQAGIALPRRGGPTVLSPNFTEPSLVYRLGSDIVLGARIDLSKQPALDTIIINDTLDNRAAEFTQQLIDARICSTAVATVEGYNYSKGDAVRLEISKVTLCPPVALTEAAIDSN